MTYLPTIPQPTDLLSTSQGNIQTNFSQANTIFGINHYPFDNVTVDKGKHTFIQFPAIPNPLPAPSGATEWTIFTQNLITPNVTTLEIFLAKPGVAPAGAYSLTASAYGPANAANGVSFLPGGLYIAFGSYAVDNNAQPIQDNSPFIFVAPGFPNTCFSLTLQGQRSGNSDFSLWVSDGTLTPTGFQIKTNSVPGDIKRLYYMAIGN